MWMSNMHLRPTIAKMESPVFPPYHLHLKSFPFQLQAVPSFQLGWNSWNHHSLFSFSPNPYWICQQILLTILWKHTRIWALNLKLVWLVTFPENNLITKEKFAYWNNVFHPTNSRYSLWNWNLLNTHWSVRACMCACVCVCTGRGALLDVIIHVRYAETNQRKQNQLVPERVGCLQMCKKFHT